MVTLTKEKLKGAGLQFQRFIPLLSRWYVGRHGTVEVAESSAS